MRWKRELRAQGRQSDPPRNIHHRKPLGKGGKDELDNVILVDVQRHRYWHQLFGIQTAVEIAWELQHTYCTEHRCQFKVIAPKGVTVISRDREVAPTVAKQIAWDAMFGDMMLVDILYEMNHVWLPPDTQIFLRRY